MNALQASHRRALVASGLAPTLALMSLGTLPLASAQDASSSVGLEEVVVTARKREETLLDVPMSISVIGRSQIEDLNLTSMVDIAKMSPGLFHTDFGSNRADRLVRSYVIRGLAVNNFNNISDGAILFVDGAPVISGNMPGTLDIERVEILKGPQTAYFGRNTFSGAVNVTTREPGDVWGGSIAAGYGSYDSSNLALSVDGPILNDTLFVRVSGEHRTEGGQYKNFFDTSDRLGGQQTDSVSVSLKFVPTERFTAKLAGSYFEYSDQPGAQARLVAPLQNCDPGRTGQNTWFCGDAPEIRADQIIYDFRLDERYRRLTLPLSIFGPGGITDQPGLHSQNLHVHANLEYLLPNEWSLESVTAYNKTQAATIANEFFDPARTNPFAAANPALRNTWNWLYLIERRFEDFSQELRLSSPATDRLRWTLGGNYVTFEATGAVIGDVPLGAPAYFPAALNESRTEAAFGGIYYDLLEKLELGVEARYQSDFVRNTPNSAAGRGTPVDVTFESFAPRVSIKYEPNPSTTFFALAARGIRPGTFNGPLIAGALPPAVQQQIIAITGAQRDVEEEELDNFEIGVKASFLEGRGFVALTGYQGRIRNQQTSQTFVVTTPAVNVGTVLVNRGETEFSGVELEVDYRATDALRLAAAFALNDTEITRGTDLSIRPLTGGSIQVVGNRLPNAPRIQGNLEASYTRALSGSLNWFAAGEYMHIGSKFAETANLLETGAQDLVNARVGVSSENLRVELWGRNLTDDRSPDLVSVAFDYNTFVNNALQVGLAKKRAFGVRASYKF